MGIDVAGKIAGYGTPPSGGPDHAFLVTPTSAPATAVTNSVATLTGASTPGPAPVDALILDNLDHWLNVGVKGSKTPAVVRG